MTNLEKINQRKSLYEVADCIAECIIDNIGELFDDEGDLMMSTIWNWLNDDDVGSCQNNFDK